MDNTEIKSKNIYQRLAEVRKSVGYLRKDNTGFSYQYVSSSQALGSLASHINEQGLILIPQILKQEVSEGKNNKGNQMFFTKLDMNFTWVNIDNPDEKIICSWAGQGTDDSEKGLGKALTYAEKYFLLKFFNIATDKDDPDTFQNKHEDKADKEERLKAEKLENQKSETEQKIKLETEAKRIKQIIYFINECVDIECLRKIRDLHSDLEKNVDFKKALGAKYRALTPPSTEDMAMDALKESQAVLQKV